MSKRAYLLVIIYFTLPFLFFRQINRGSATYCNSDCESGSYATRICNTIVISVTLPYMKFGCSDNFSAWSRTKIDTRLDKNFSDGLDTCVTSCTITLCSVATMSAFKLCAASPSFNSFCTNCLKFFIS